MALDKVNSNVEELSEEEISEVVGGIGRAPSENDQTRKHERSAPGKSTGGTRNIVRAGGINIKNKLTKGNPGKNNDGTRKVSKD